MDKELTPSEAWKLIYKSIEDALQDYETLQDDFNKLYERTYKEHKALEIIKDTGIVVQFIKETNSVEQYNAVISGLLLKPLTKQEYDLLKEVLR